MTILNTITSLLLYSKKLPVRFREITGEEIQKLAVKSNKQKFNQNDWIGFLEVVGRKQGS